MKSSFFITTALLLLAGCNNTTNPTTQGTHTTTTTQSADTSSTLPPLTSQEVFFKNKNPFGEDIALEGRNITGDTALIQIKEPELTIKNNQLLMKNLTSPVLHIFNLPSLRLQKSIGKRGQGPDEFMFPTLVPSATNDALGYLYEVSLHKLYKINKNAELEPLTQPFKEKKRDAFGSSMQLVNIGTNDFLYVSDSKTGKSIFRITQTADSTQLKEITTLGLNPARKSPFSYIGSFAATPQKNRMVYAYKYFKIIKFMDLEAKTIKTINFEREEFNEGSTYVVNGLDQNVSHYFGACAGDKYVYFLYIGRTPFDVTKEWGKENYYIFVEQYDWNGNPIKRYRLNQFGKITVDEAQGKLYLVSNNYDDPFFEFNLP